MPLPYNIRDPFSIERYAKSLLNKSLREYFGENAVQSRAGKGKLGQLVEELYFQYKPNSNARADFEEAGLELKTTPIKNIKKGFVAKERLVFNIIDYHKEHLDTFQNSSFWKKNALLLLMFYLYEKESLDIDYIFKIIRLWRFPAKDLRIIKDDWEKIVQKIRDGKAHLISEGDTLYLGACTKGANRESTRTQPFSKEPAKQRAFSLKPNYLNFIIQESIYKAEVLADDSEYRNILNESESIAAEPAVNYSKNILPDTEAIIKNIEEYKEGETFEELIIRKFKPYYGKSADSLLKEFEIDPSIKAKNKFEIIAKAILGVKKKHIEEFEKADVLMKTIRLETNNSIKESMSFRQIQYKEIVQDDWDESVWYEELNRRFFFIVFKVDINGSYKLSKVFFWSIPERDMNVLESVWEDTKAKIQKGDFDNFIKSSANRIGHVRPKGRDSNDVMEAPNGSMQKKKCFWLNRNYIKSIIQKHQIE